MIEEFIGKTEAWEHWKDTLNKSKVHPVVLTMHGQPEWVILDFKLYEEHSKAIRKTLDKA